MRILFLVPFSFFLFTSLTALLGCQSYTIVQRNVFADDDGVAVTIHYGRAERDHVNTFVSPSTGQEVEFVSRLLIKAEAPNGEMIKAWQCMNFLSYGTMYESDDKEWKFLLNGFSINIFRRTDEQPPRYREVYRGVLCATQNSEREKDDRWREVRPASAREYKKTSPAKK